MSELTTTYEWKDIPWQKLERKVFKLQKQIYQASKNGKRSKVRRLQRLLIKSWAARTLATRKVSQDNQGKKTAGIDGLKSLTPKQRLILVQNLKLNTEKASLTRRVWIPKPGNSEEKRPLNIPTIFDRAKQTLYKMALESEWEAKFEANSFGFRPGRSCHDAIIAIYQNICHKPKWILETDISKCFDSIPHHKLLILIRERVRDGSMLRIVKQSLKVAVAYAGKVELRRIGVPQGSPISPLYSNIYLNLIDRVWHTQGYPEKLGARFHRYADDVILVCRRNAERALAALEAIARHMDLTLNQDKTRITPLREGFNFIGFEFVKRRSPSSGKQRIYIFPSKRSQGNIRHKIRSFMKRRAPIKPQEFVRQINQAVLGWANYYRHTNASQAFRSLQRFINIRFRRYLNYRSKRRGFGWKQFPNQKLYAMGIIYIGSGFIRYERATVHARQ